MKKIFILMIAILGVSSASYAVSSFAPEQKEFCTGKTVCVASNIKAIYRYNGSSRSIYIDVFRAPYDKLVVRVRETGVQIEAFSTETKGEYYFYYDSTKWKFSI